jgi:hypothetical protein
VIHPLVQGDSENDAIPGFTKNAELVWRHPLAVNDDASAHPLQYIDLRPIRGDDVIFLFETKFGVHDPVRQLAIVGEEQEPFRIAVEPADGIEALGRVDEIHHRPPLALVAGGGDVAARLVEHDIATALRANDFAINSDGVGVGIGLAAKLRDDHTIYGNSAGYDHFLGHASGCDATSGKNALDALHAGGASVERARITRGRKSGRGSLEHWQVGHDRRTGKE